MLSTWRQMVREGGAASEARDVWAATSRRRRAELAAAARRAGGMCMVRADAVEAGHVYETSLPTLTTSTQQWYAVVHEAAATRMHKVGPLHWLSAMGHGSDAGMRAAVEAVAPTVATALLGQSVERRSMEAVWQRALQLLGHRAGQRLRYADGYSGMGAAAAVMRQCAGEGFEYVFRMEPLDACNAANTCSNGAATTFTHAHEAADIAAALALGQVDVYGLYPRCGPTSRERDNAEGHSAQRLQDIEDGLAETRAAMGYIRAARPRLAVLEFVGALLGPARRETWTRIVAMLHEMTEYEWQVWRTRPDRDLGTRQARDRVWAVGRHKGGER